MITVVDLFAGIGGLSLGFEAAGARCVVAVESNPHHAAAYRAAHSADTIVLQAPVEQLSARDLALRSNLVLGDIDIVVGGPPCQPFSNAGKRQGTLDVRGNLIYDFLRFVAELQPRTFVMENVIGLKSIHNGELLSDVRLRFEVLGYKTKQFILDAADYGVPQHRRRLFLLGIRGEQDLSLPLPSHGSPCHHKDLFGGLLRPLVTVRDAIWDLPGSRFQKRSRHTDDLAEQPYQTGSPNEYQRLMRGSNTSVTGNGVTTHLSHIVKAIDVRSLPQGAMEPSTRYRRLFWDRPAFTLRAGSGTFTALRPIHPSQSRVITVREAARLQSFPDRIQFSPSKIHAYQQIGNSVPPLLANAVAKVVVGALRGGRARA